MRTTWRADNESSHPQERAAPAAVETALECDFPLVEINQITDQENCRKEINRLIYHIHKWWATRFGPMLRVITIWMGKLLYRLNAGRHGGCPILVFGITPKLIADWKQP